MQKFHLSFTPQNPFSGRHFRAAFTLTEVMMGLALLGLVTMSTYHALGTANDRAVRARLQTGALVVAQDRIDFILSAGPFIPQTGTFPAAPALTAPRTETPPFTLRPGTYVQTNVPIYTDPASPSRVIPGTMTTVVADSGVQVNGGGIDTSRATVTVDYRYRGRSYSVTLGTLRASEQ